MADKFFYFDQNRCIACDTCTVQCKDWNGINPGEMRWRKVHRTEEGTFPTTKVYNTVYSCGNCDDPACIKACSNGAIMRDADTGTVYIDRARCVSLQQCVIACPYKAISVADDSQENPVRRGGHMVHVAKKCDSCRSRLKEGKKPACVDSCIQRALDFDTEANLKAKYGSSIARYFNGEVKGFPADTATVNGQTVNTKPRIFFKTKNIV